MTTTEYINRITQVLASGDPALLRDAALCVRHLSGDWSHVTKMLEGIERIERAAGVGKGTRGQHVASK